MRKFQIVFVLLGCALFCAHAVRGDGFIRGVVPFPNPAPVATPNANGGWLGVASFPSGLDDLSFTQSVVMKAKKYEPFQDMQVYRGLVVEGEEHFIERQLAMGLIERDQDAAVMSDKEYCEKYPLDETRCTQTPDLIVGIVDAGNVSSQSRPIVSGDFNGKTIGGGVVVANNQVHGGSCYPAAKSDIFKKDSDGNKVLTTGRYESVSPAFEKALITIFRKEGKCGTIKNDPCGYTCYGIGSKCMNIDVSNLTRADAEDIYYNRFWKKYDIQKLPDVISGDIMLASMASGPCTAIQQFRNFLGLSKNCKIDDEVVRAVENYNGDIHNDWLDVRQKFLIEVAERRYQNLVLKGWMNAIKLKRENGCHVIPARPMYRE